MTCDLTSSFPEKMKRILTSSFLKKMRRYLTSSFPEKVRCDLTNSFPEKVPCYLVSSFPDKMPCGKEGLTAVFPVKMSLDYTPDGCAVIVSGIIISAV